MKACLHRYWLKEFLRYFCIIQIILLTIFIFIDYLSRIDNFLNSDVTMARGLWCVLLKLPFMFVQFAPACLLLAVIYAFGVMNRNRELMALKASGISVYFLIKPALLAGSVLALAAFFLGETIVPSAMVLSNHIWNQERSGNKNVSHRRSDIWIKSNQGMLHIDFFDPAHERIAGITATTLGKGFKILRRVDAKTGEYHDGKWRLTEVAEQVLNPEKKEYIVRNLPTMELQLDIKPEDLGAVVLQSEEMSWSQLRAYIRQITAEGYDAATYKVDMNGKLAFPFISVILALAGAATGMSSLSRNNLPGAVGVGIVISFLYWFAFGLCISLGYAKILPPLAAAWVSNLVFFCLGGIFLIYIE
ncbi:LPS export ABC transporter permease LptG [uncultured Desulfobacter sp.]|uniref:LPS export ABC transporter permease LptG n=1 Tax=uncultured Desulfobacter sp. TaxID=240139 RepID=UPI002AAA805B|nr:LPS export ABC transporter permease LptG [uncultured Desulfobacter sp.]